MSAILIERIRPKWRAKGNSPPGPEPAPPSIGAKRLIIFIVAAIAATLAATATTPEALAYPQHGNNCNDNTIRWEFAGGGWTSNKKRQVKNAFESLETALDHKGKRLVQVSDANGQSRAQGVVKVELRYHEGNENGGLDREGGSHGALDHEDEGLDQPLGSSECNGGSSIWLNDRKLTTNEKLRKTARHEMFHLAGAEHGGKRDSFNGDNPPTMSTCLSPNADLPTTNKLAQDDAAYLNWLHNSLPNRQLHANIGFEQGASFWGKKKAELRSYSTEGSSGPGHVGIVSTANSSRDSYIFQTVRLWTGDDDVSYRARINVKKPVERYRSYASAALYYRAVNADGTDKCKYADGLDGLSNDPKVKTGWIKLDSVYTSNVTTSWRNVTTGWKKPGTTADGYDFQVRAYGKSYCDGCNGTIRFDNVRAEGKS